MQTADYLIIGNGAAGATAAETFRKHNRQATIVVATAEPYPMYSRPGLAYVLNNTIPAPQIITRGLDWYQERQIDLFHGEAHRILPQQKQVLFTNGDRIRYGKLLIAVGARATKAPYTGADLRGVVYLDTMAGTEEMIRLSRRARKAVVIGGGITAMEMVEGLAARGVETHYFLRRDRLWSQVFNEAEAAILEKRMASHHIRIHYHTEISEILGNRRGNVRAVRLQSGEEFKCDMVGIGIGVRPQVGLVANSPIEVDRGILVDEYFQTAVPDIYAAGDCAQVYDRWTQSHQLDILWPSAVAAGNAAALNMLGRQFPYKKGSPFNACLLFGLHISTLGQINPRPDENESDPHVLQHISRGSSEVWFTSPQRYRSAWSKEDENTIRLIINERRRLVGALIMGEQILADCIRYLIENEIDISAMTADLAAGGQRMQFALQSYWKSLQQQLPSATVQSGNGERVR
jgi:NAD(P)H-nitrite reductase large subunit